MYAGRHTNFPQDTNILQTSFHEAKRKPEAETSGFEI